MRPYRPRRARSISDQLLFGSALEDLIGEDADQHDCSHDGKIEGAGNAEEVDEILQDLQKRRADDDADDRTFAAAQTAAAQDGCRDAIEFVEISVVRWGNRV